MVWVMFTTNALLWVGYLAGVTVFVWGTCPAWGGWHTLNFVGKGITVLGGIVGLGCALTLVTTSVLPF